jgi:transcriptional regulator with XRE-family HTH domain
LVPNEVVGYMVKESLSPAAAWRKHLGLSQAQVAERIGITQSAYAQQEQAASPRKQTREKIAAALGIAPDLWDI